MVEFHGVALDHAQPPGVSGFEFGKSGQAAPVHLDRGHPGPGLEQRAGQAAWAGSDFKHRLVPQIARNRRDPVEQMRVEQEVLTQCLRGGKAVAGDDVAQRGEFGIHASP